MCEAGWLAVSWMRMLAHDTFAHAHAHPLTHPPTLVLEAGAVSAWGHVDQPKMDPTLCNCGQGRF